MIIDTMKSKLFFGSIVTETLYNKNYTAFIITLLIGIAFIMISFLFLPLVVLYPQKFCVLFSLGSLTIIISLSFLQSPVEYIRSFFTGKNTIFSICYLGALIFYLYASLVLHKYLMTLLATVVHFSTLLYFIASRFSNGMQIVGMLKT